MSDFKQRVLRKLAGNLSEGTEWAMDKLDRPGRATRAGISALQNDGDAWEAVKEQFGSNPPEAPSGSDIADKFSEDYDVTNPYALTALATAAEVVDPTMFIPGGQVGKLGKVAKIAKGGETAADILKGANKAETAAEMLAKIPKGKFGRTVVVPTAEEKALAKMAATKKANISAIPEQKVETTLPEIFGKQQTDELYEQFPNVADKYRDQKVIAAKKLLESE